MTDRTLHWASFAFFTVLGLGLAWAPVWLDTTSSAAVGFVLFGLAVLTVPLMTWTQTLAARRPERAVTPRDGGLAIALRTTPAVAVAILGVVWAAFAGWAVAAGGIPAGLLAVPFVALFGALVPDSLRAIARRPHLYVDADEIRLRSWSLDGAVAWEDVVAAEVVRVRPQRAVIRLVVRPGAASLSRTWHRYLVRLDLPTDEHALDVPLVALDDPARVAAFLTLLRGLPRDGRLRELQGAGPAFLRGEVQLER